MNLAETFALTCGLKIDEPYILDEFYPTTIDLSKAIIIHTNFEKEAPARRYDYFMEMVDLCRSELEKRGYFFVQISEQKDKKVKWCKDHFFELSPHQIAYIVKRCKLVISDDNIVPQIASHFKTKNITLYGSSSHIAHRPCFDNGEFSRVIYGYDKNPSFLENEFPKQINNIKPEEIANEIFASLGIEFTTKVKSLFFGPYYPSLIFNIVPDHVPNPASLQGNLFSIRMDYFYDQKNLEAILAGRKCNIVSEKPIDINLLKKYKGNVGKIDYGVSLGSDISYCQSLKSIGIPVLFYTKEKGEELNKIRFNFFDFATVESLVETEKPEEIKLVDENTKIKTCKFILSNGKIYLSKSHWKAGLSIESFGENSCKVIDDNDFWKDVKFFYIYQEEKD